jgi:hypothetical protein
MSFKKITYYKTQATQYICCDCENPDQVKELNYNEFQKIKCKYIMLSDLEINKENLKIYTKTQFKTEYDFLKENKIDLYEYYSYSGFLFNLFVETKNEEKNINSFNSLAYKKVLFEEYNNNYIKHNNGGYNYHENGEYKDAYTLDFTQFYPNSLSSKSFLFPLNEGQKITLDFYKNIIEEFKLEYEYDYIREEIMGYKLTEEDFNKIKNKFEIGYYNIYYYDYNEETEKTDIKKRKKFIFPYDFECFYIDTVKLALTEKIIYIEYDNHYIYNKNETDENNKINKFKKGFNPNKKIINGNLYFGSTIDKLVKLQNQYILKYKKKNFIIKRLLSSFAGVLSKKNYEKETINDGIKYGSNLTDKDLENFDISFDNTTEYIIIEEKMKIINNEPVFLYTYLKNNETRLKYNFRFYPFLIAFSRLILMKTINYFSWCYFKKYNKMLNIIRVCTDSITFDRDMSEFLEDYHKVKYFYKMKKEEKTSGDLIIYNNRIKRRCEICSKEFFNNDIDKHKLNCIKVKPSLIVELDI